MGHFIEHLKCITNTNHPEGGGAAEGTLTVFLVSRGGGSGGGLFSWSQRSKPWVGGAGLKIETAAGGLIWARKPWWLLADERESMVVVAQGREMIELFPFTLAHTIYLSKPQTKRRNMTEEDKPKALSGSHHHHQPPPPQPQPYPPPPQYGTFQGVSNYPPPPPDLHPAIGFPHPVPPPGATDSPPPPYYPHGYQAVPGYAVAEGRPVREPRLPCCGLGCGWFMFILGFLLAGIPWYVGAIIMLCSRVDYREKPGYVACIVAAILATIAIIFGVTKGTDDW